MASVMLHLCLANEQNTLKTVKKKIASNREAVHIFLAKIVA